MPQRLKNESVSLVDSDIIYEGAAQMMPNLEEI